MVLLLAGMQLAVYLTPEKGGLDDARAKALVALKTTVTQRAYLDKLASKTGQADAQPKSGEVDASFLKALDALKASIARSSKEDLDAERTMVVMQAYAGQSPDDLIVGDLAMSSDAKSRYVGRVLEGAQNLKRPSGEDDFDILVAEWVAKSQKPYLRADHSSLVTDERLNRFILAFGGGFLGLAAGVASLAFVSFMTLTKRWRSKGFFEHVPKPYADNLALRFLLYLFFYVFTGLVGALLAQSGASSLVVMILTQTAILLAVPVFFWLPINRVSINWRNVLGDTSQPASKVATGVMAWLSLVPLELFVTMVAFTLLKNLPTPSHGAIEELVGNNSLATWVGIGFMAAVLAPIIEEFMFRGALYPALAVRLKSPVWGAVICGLIFATIHPQGPILWPALALIGAGSAVTARMTGSLIPSITLHACQNFAVLLVNYLING